MASRGRGRSRGRSGSGGGSKKFLDFMAFLLVGALVVAFFKVPSHQTADGTLSFFSGKMETVKVWAEGLGSRFSLGDLFNGQAAGESSGTGGQEVPNSSAPVDPGSATAAVEQIAIADAASVKYNRDEWKHWDNLTSCWTVREEVLYRQSEPGTIKISDANKKETTDKNAACNIVSGVWVDPYTGKSFSNAKDLDIDHMIPLGYTAAHGGQAWDATRKAQYANSQEPGHLLAVSASANRSKSDRGPSEWKPSNKSNWCAYSTNWVSVATTWGISITQADKEALKEMLATC